MPPDNAYQLDYAKKPSAEAISADILKAIVFSLSLILIQFVWGFFSGICVIQVFMDGLPKRPLRDFVCYAVWVAPSIIATIWGLAYLRARFRRGTLRRAVWVMAPTMLLAILVCGLALRSWVRDDVIDRNVPHETLGSFLD